MPSCVTSLIKMKPKKSFAGYYLYFIETNLCCKKYILQILETISLWANMRAIWIILTRLQKSLLNRVTTNSNKGTSTRKHMYLRIFVPFSMNFTISIYSEEGTRFVLTPCPSKNMHTMNDYTTVSIIMIVSLLLGLVFFSTHYVTRIIPGFKWRASDTVAKIYKSKNNNNKKWLGWVLFFPRCRQT